MNDNMKLIYYVQCRHSLMRNCGDGVRMGTVFTGTGGNGVKFLLPCRPLVPDLLAVSATFRCPGLVSGIHFLSETSDIQLVSRIHIFCRCLKIMFAVC